MKKNRRNIMLVIVLVSLLAMQTTMVSAFIDIPRPPSPDPDQTYRMYGTIKDDNTDLPITGALVKFYAESSIYLGATTTSSTGYFNYYKTMRLYDWVQIRVTKSGYSELRDTDRPSGTYYYFGTNYMESAAPPQIDYTIHGFVKNIITTEAIADADVDIFRDSFGAWEFIGTVTTSSDGSFTLSYSTTLATDQVRAITDPIGFGSGASIVDVQGTNVDMGELLVLSDTQSFHEYTVEGKILDAEAQDTVPYAEVVISAFYNGNWNWVGATTTTGSGLYNFDASSFYIWEAVKVLASKEGYESGSRISMDDSYGLFWLDGTYGHPAVELNSPIESHTIIVAIDDYPGSINDLSDASTDANHWIEFLTGVPYPHEWPQDDILVYGDSNPSSYTIHTAEASEALVKDALREMVTKADHNDLVSFIVSAHGGPGSDYGDSGIGLYDYYLDKPESGYDYTLDEDSGMLWDWELAQIFQYTIADRVFMFLSSCFSGGFIDDFEELQNCEHFFVTTACGVDGVGIMELGRGSWWAIDFLVNTLMDDYPNDANVDLNTIFTQALLERDWDQYNDSYDCIMTPQVFCVYDGSFTLYIPPVG